jgi:hypothetical protein
MDYVYWTNSCQTLFWHADSYVVLVLAHHLPGGFFLPSLLMFANTTPNLKSPRFAATSGTSSRLCKNGTDGRSAERQLLVFQSKYITLVLPIRSSNAEKYPPPSRSPPGQTPNVAVFSTWRSGMGSCWLYGSLDSYGKNLSLCYCQC